MIFGPHLKPILNPYKVTIDIEYGKGIGSDIISDCKVILLNRIGGLDRTEEVIIDGNIIGIFLFDPLKVSLSISSEFNWWKIYSVFSTPRKK